VDKYEFRISLQEINKLIAERRFDEAADIADTIDWSRVKSPETLCKISDVYKINKEYEKSRRTLVLANSRDPQSADIIYSLCELTIFLYGKDGMQTDLASALALMQSYQAAEPENPRRLILQYKMYNVSPVPVAEKIAVLEQLRDESYSARWAYELAECYHEAGMDSEALDTCKHIIADFEGRYVDKATRLIGQIYAGRSDEGVQEKKPEKPADKSENRQPAPQDGEDIEDDTKPAPSRPGREKKAHAGSEEPEEKKTENASRVAPIGEPDQSQAGADALQSNVARGMKDILTRPYENRLTQESSGQYAMVQEEPSGEEKQVEGQMSIGQVMDEWERIRKGIRSANDQKRMQKVLEDTGPIMQDFEETARHGLLEDIEKTISQQQRSARIGTYGDYYERGDEADDYVRGRGGYQDDREPDGRGYDYDDRDYDSDYRRYDTDVDVRGGYQDDFEEMRRYRNERDDSVMYRDEEPEDREESYRDEEPEDSDEERYERGYDEAPDDMPERREAQPRAYDEESYGSGRPERSGRRSHAQRIADRYRTAGRPVRDDEDRQQAERASRAEKRAEDIPAEDDNQPGSFLDSDEQAPVTAEAEQTNTSAPEQPEENTSETEPQPEAFDEAKEEADLEQKEEAPGDKEPETEPDQEEVITEAEPKEEPEQTAAPAETGKKASVYEFVRKESETEEDPLYDGDGDYQDETEIEDLRTRRWDADAVRKAMEAEKQKMASLSGRHAESRTEAKPQESLDDPDSDSAEALDDEDPVQTSPAAQMPEEEPADKPEKREPEPVFDTHEPEEEPAAQHGEEPVRTPEQEPEPEEEPQRPAGRVLSPEEKKIFGPFCVVRENRVQLVNALDKISLASYTGNVIVIGGEATGRRVAQGLLEMQRRGDSNFTGKIAKASGTALSKLSTRKLEATIAQIENGALIVENASAMSEEILQDLQIELEEKDHGLIVILLDSKKAMEPFVKQYERYLGSFNITIEIKPLNDKALVGYGLEYAKSKDYSIDEFGQMALSSRIASMQTPDHHVTMKEVREIVDEAISYASKKTPDKLLEVITNNRYDKDDRIILHEKDFQHY